MRSNRELGLAVPALRRGTQKTPARATLLAVTNPQRCCRLNRAAEEDHGKNPGWRQTARERGVLATGSGARSGKS
jgi:hypothetical protein